jgi:hypothetical protein
MSGGLVYRAGGETGGVQVAVCFHIGWAGGARAHVVGVVSLIVRSFLVVVVCRWLVGLGHSVLLVYS